MKVNIISQKYYKNIPSNVMETEGIFGIEPQEDCKKQKVFSNQICFNGGVPLTKLINDYNRLIHVEKNGAINSFLQLEAQKESLDSLLRFILKDDKLSHDFFYSITDQVRSNRKFYNELVKKIPSRSDLLNFGHPLSPYYKSYEKYIDDLYLNAESVSDLLKIRPDWKEDVLLKKHRDLYHNDSFELGFVPDCIGKENFPELVQYLRLHSQFGFKMHKDIPDLKLNGNNFKIYALIDGKSDKNVFNVVAENGESFIIKIASVENKSLDEPFALGTLAKIDMYLTRNNCRNSAPIRYYSHDMNTAIYDYINHSKVPRVADVSQSGKKIPDFVDLGMRQNDTVGSNNYFKLDKTQTALKNSYDFRYGVEHEELISVDNDHATYVNILAPRIDKYHKDLPNAMLGMFF